MGGAVSAGMNNDELIDNLVGGDYIKTPMVENVFRAVDRGDYYILGCREGAYRDLAWKHGRIHLSAPCIYSEVMEALKLGPNMSFLNLGSGTGYLSTMAGLILGPYGTNHGVEVHKDVVEYSKTRLEDFILISPSIDKYEFCCPTFVVGNCLLLDGSVQQYDRVYCGASCPIEHENYMKNLIRIGGILVMPFNDTLVQITRTGQTSYEIKSLIPVSFAPLVLPSNSTQATIKLPEFQSNLFSLQELCRLSLRAYLRKIIELENPSLLSKRETEKKICSKTSVVFPIYHEHSDLDGTSPNDRQSDTEDNDEDVSDPSDSAAVRSNFSERGLFGTNASKIVVDFTSHLHFAETSNEWNNVLKEDRSDEKEESGLESSVANKEKEQEDSMDSISDDDFPFKVDMEEVKDIIRAFCPPRHESFPIPRPRCSLLKRSAEDDGEKDEERSDSKLKERDGQRLPLRPTRSSITFKRVALNDDRSENVLEADSDSGSETHTVRPGSNTDLSIYSSNMRKKIVNLPLPRPLKLYLNYARSFK